MIPPTHDIFIGLFFSFPHFWFPRHRGNIYESSLHRRLFAPGEQEHKSLQARVECHSFLMAFCLLRGSLRATTIALKAKPLPFAFFLYSSSDLYHPEKASLVFPIRLWMYDRKKFSRTFVKSSRSRWVIKKNS